jgi:lysophospholipase L1-like esterase
MHRKVLFTLFTTVFLLGTVKSQVSDYPHEMPTFPFIRYQENQLEWYGDSVPLKQFFKKLDQLIFRGTGKINMVHIGGSHVQADVLSGRIRERFSTLFPGNRGSRGLIFPFQLARTNNPPNYYVTHTGAWRAVKNVGRESDVPLGLTGMAVITEEMGASLTVYLKKERYPAYDFNHIRVFHGRGPQRMKVVIAGADTLGVRSLHHPEDGITEFFLSSYLHAVTLQLEAVDSVPGPFALYGIQLENSDPGITYHAVGVNGAGTYSYLKCAYFKDHLRELKPDVVVFGLGINDAAGSGFSPEAFQGNYRQLMRMVREVNPKAMMILITNNDSFRRMHRERYAVNQNGLVVRDAMRYLAQTEGCGLWDFFTVMGGLQSMAVWQSHGLAQGDKVHFTSTGYRLMGDLLFSAMLKSYEKHLLRNEP